MAKSVKAGREGSSQAAGPTKAAPKKSAGKPRASKATRWRAGILILVHVLAAIHIAHWMTTGSTVSPFEPSESMEFAKKSVVNTGLVFFAITILSTLFLGRWFCGWACHVVALQDLSRALLLKVGIRPRPLKSKWMALLPVAAAFYMFLWPLLFRYFILDEPLGVQETHFISEGDEFWSTFTRSWFVAGITFFVAGFAAVYFLGAKGFCTYACPYGAVFGVVDKLSPGRIRVTDACVECGHCTLTCTSNVDVSREVHDYGMVVDKGCMKCMDCVSVCPENALYFGMGKPAIFAKPRQEKRPAPKSLPFVEEASGFAAFVFAYFAYRGNRQEADFLLSMGLAACFGLFAVLVVRMVRRADVRLPGLKLKSAGKVAPLGLALGVGTLGVAAAGVPYGIVPAWGMFRADVARRDLDDAIMATERTGQPAKLTAEQRATAETMLDSSLSVRRWSSVFKPENFDRIVWGTILLEKPDVLRETVNGVIGDPALPVAIKSDAAGVFRNVGMIADAEAAYRSVIAEDPGHVPAISGLIQLLGAQGKTADAREVLGEGLQRLPDDPNLLLARGIFAADRKDFSAAAVDFRGILDADPLNGVARDQLWRVLTTSGKPGEAVVLLREGLALPDAPEEWRAHLAQILLQSQKADEAIAEARILAAPDQDNIQLLMVAQAVFQAAGAVGDAQSVAQRISKMQASAPADKTPAAPNG